MAGRSRTSGQHSASAGRIAATGFSPISLIRRRRFLDTGVGRIVDLSSGSVLLGPGRAPPVGLNIEMAICWLVLLPNEASMQLIVSGKIVRAGRNRIAVAKVQYEFRTSGVSADRAGKNGAARSGDFRRFTGRPFAAPTDLCAANCTRRQLSRKSPEGKTACTESNSIGPPSP